MKKHGHSLDPAQAGSGEWWQYDFGFTQSWSQIRILWEAAYASDYEVQVSNDGVVFTTIHSAISGGGYEILNVAGSGRYLRLKLNYPGTPWGYSIYDVGVF